MTTSHIQFGKMELNEDMLPADPFTLFQNWLEFASKDEPMGGICFSLATADATGKPSSRILLFNEITEGGFSFYTNYSSRKSRELEENNQACAQFFWSHSERQVRINGLVHKISQDKSEAYFATRPRESQIGAWASAQSAEITGREVLEQQVIHFTQKFEGMDVPRPEHWGGFVVVPDEVEFWQGRLSRLHDRIVYARDGQLWNHSRLSP